MEARRPPRSVPRAIGQHHQVVVQRRGKPRLTSIAVVGVGHVRVARGPVVEAAGLPLNPRDRRDDPDLVDDRTLGPRAAVILSVPVIAEVFMRIRSVLIAVLVLSAIRLSPVLDARVDPLDTKMLTQPAVSAAHVAFIYAGDLFVADLNAAGTVANVRRLTTDDGVESNPGFSPDGKTIAFSAQYEGNVDVYTVPVSGGAPTRLTWHPGADTVQGFTPDGRAILFTSQRATFTAR